MQVRERECLPIPCIGTDAPKCIAYMSQRIVERLTQLKDSKHVLVSLAGPCY